MTIAEALTQATAGGYHINRSDGMATYDSGASRPYSAWTRKDNDSTLRVAVEETLLDPAFWQAFGSALGWAQAMRTVHAVENGRPTVVTRTGHHWRYHWHRFIDHLAEGQDVEPSLRVLLPPSQSIPWSSQGGM